MDKEIDYKKLYEIAKAANESLKAENDAFKLSGRVKLFYAINKQQNDLADMLNGINLKNIDIADTKDKTVERLEKIWKSIGVLSPIVDTLKISSGISGDENKDLGTRKPFVDTIASSK